MSNELFPSIGSVVDGPQGPEERAEAPEQAAEDEDRLVQEIDSLCMRCEKQGITRLLLISIPFFREVIVMSFRCEHCGFSNNETQAASTIRPEGGAYTARALSRADLDRQIVKSSTCSVTIPEFELTIPPGRGQLTTVEGLIRDVVTDLSADQPLRRIENEETYNKIQTILDGFKEILADNEEDADGDVPPQKAAPMRAFTIIVDDPTGNSFLEFVGNMADPKWNMRTYRRTRQQNIDLGLISPDDVEESTAVTEEQEGQAEGAEEEPKAGLEEQSNEEIFAFPGTCSSCGHYINTLMKKVNIPYFKDIIIMSTNCEFCGYRDNEVKSGSAISSQGKRITLKVEDKEDLSRDVLKSESCGMEIPEIDLVLQPGTLGGRFTTLEGLLDQIYDELATKALTASDSHLDDAFATFLEKLKEVKNSERSFTVILDDPLANSYLQNIYAPDPDPNMTIELYDRTWEQNEDLGLNDMKV